MSANLSSDISKTAYPQSSQSAALKKVKKYFPTTNQNDTANLLSLFLSYIFNDISKRSAKPFDMFTLTELTDLPLIVCEKICQYISPLNGILNQTQFISCMHDLFFCNDKDNSYNRLMLVSKICDFKKKNVIYKSDVKILLLHLHMHIVPQSYQRELIDIINNFFGKKSSMSTHSFLDRSVNINGDIAYLFYLFFDKFSFGNYDQFDLFNRDIFKGKEKIDKYTIKKYKMDLISQKAVEYGKRITKSKIEKEAFDEDSDDQLDDLDNFENEIAETMNNYSTIKKGSTTIADINAFSTGTTSDFRLKTHMSQKSEGAVVPLTEERKEGYIEKTERVNKTLELLSKSRGFYFTPINPNTSRRATSTKRTYDCPINDSFVEESSKNYTYNIPVSQPYNEIICLKQSKKQKGLIQVKLIHINTLLFYFKSVVTTNTTEDNNSSMTSICGTNPLVNKNTFSNSQSSHSNNTSISYNNPNSSSMNLNTYVITKYVLKRIILTKRLYPTIIKYPNKIHFQLQLTSSLHNTQSVINFYSQNEIHLVAFAKTLSQSQHQCGRNITDVYELSHEVGKGKFGSVSIATHRISSKQVAIKVVSKIEASSEESYKSNKWENDIFKFLQNASTACENIIRCYEFFETPNYLYYVTEYVPDGNLKDYVCDAMNNNTKISEKDINEICKQMLTGISFLHSYGIIHRDIKHTNTLVEKTHSCTDNQIFTSKSNHKQIINPHHVMKIKLIDFGLSKAMGYEDTAIEPYGSLSFKAPELILENPYSFGVDLWSLGITIYYVMFHRFPVMANDKSSLKEKILSENYLGTMIQKGVTIAAYASKVIFQCLVKDPIKRINADDLLSECK